MATDGCLSSDGRHLSFGSGDRDLVVTLLRCLRLSTSVRINQLRTTKGSAYYRVQFGRVRLYRWLLAIGLTPRKSLTLGALGVPDDYLIDTVRGLLDGDGSVLTFSYAGSGKAAGRTYVRLMTRFTSASGAHVEWIHGRLRSALGIHGSISRLRSASGNPFFHLTYSTGESRVLLAVLYADHEAPCLRRKRANWERFLTLETSRASNATAPRRASGSAK